MTANEKMDAILTFLNKAYDESNLVSYAKENDGNTIRIPKEPIRASRSIYEILWGATLRIKKGNYVVFEFEAILEYLQSEHLIQMINEEYKIVWEGKVFIENGGFKSKRKKEIILETLQLSMTVAIALGTILAALGTVGLLFFEYVKLNHHYPFGLHFWKIGGVISSLLILILLLYLLQVLIPKRK